MKKMILLIASLLPLAVMAQDGYTISGKISHLKTPAKAYLAMVEDGRFRDKDSAEVKDGKFQFKGSVDAPQQVIISINHYGTPTSKRQEDNLGFFLENSKISIVGTDSIKNATVSGSRSDKENRELEASIEPLTNIIIKLNKDFHGKPKDAAYQKASDSVTRLIAEIKNIHLKFAESHLNSFMGLYVYNLYVLDSHADPAIAGPLFDKFSPELQSSELGKRTLEKIASAKRRQTGIKVTDFTQNDLNGNPFTLSSLRGKYVLVDFWASWCAPCRAESPNLVKAYQQLKGKNFEVVSVSLDQSKAAWENAVKTDKLPWIQVCDLKGWKNDVAAMYGINAVPQNILINPEGVIIAKNLRGEDLTEKLSALIK